MVSRQRPIDRVEHKGPRQLGLVLLACGMVSRQRPIVWKIRGHVSSASSYWRVSWFQGRGLSIVWKIGAMSARPLLGGMWTELWQWSHLRLGPIAWRPCEEATLSDEEDSCPDLQSTVKLTYGVDPTAEVPLRSEHFWLKNGERTRVGCCSGLHGLHVG